MSAPTISTEGLRELLEQGAPVTVLDVRPGAEYAEWSIPGSVHADAYEALRRRDPNALADFRPTNGGRVVTVCAAGKTSMLAAERLRARGLDAASLDPRVYRRVADEHGWRIRTVLETHVHADHLSRARALAVDTGARLCLPTTDRVSFEYAPLKDGDTLHVGSAGLRVFHTPGHTPESACYLLSERVLFTGDTLFLAAVGRPDLEASAEQARRRAHVLHASLQRLVGLPPETVVLPAHTSEPVAFDGRPISATLGEVQGRTLLLRETEEAFVGRILARLPPTPPNHHRIVALNEAGTLPDDPTELEAGANRCAVA